ncbi:flagellar filament capping protein FliD [Alcanivorax sp. N3-2A]|nr:flagellar filament capping protein FliD [Alcanivorax sp. N3-2A]
MASISALGVGSGMDLSGLLDQLAAAEKQKLTPIAQQQQSYQTKISAFGKLESALAKFREAAQDLDDPKQFQAVKKTLTGESLTATTANGAPTGTYSIEVTQTARAYSIATSGVADKDETLLGDGTLTFDMGDGESFSVNIKKDDSSLEDIRDAINEANGGVRASIISDGSDQPYRLVLSSEDSGTEGAVSEITFSGDLGGALALDQDTEVSARNALLDVNGIKVESQSNHVEEAIQDVTLNITELGTSTLELTRDDSAIKKAVGAFVDAYNDLKENMGSLSKHDAESQTAGVLLGNSTLRGIESQLRGVLSGGLEQGDFRLLSDMGITLQRDGTLEIDDDDLDDAIAENAAGMSAFFAGVGGNDGLAAKLDDTLGGMLDDGGSLDNVTDGLNASIDSLQDTYDRTNERISATIERYRTQFSQLDSLVSQMNSTSSYLTQQFDALSAITKS